MVDHTAAVQTLMRRGFDLLHRHECAEAIKVGLELKKLHHSSAFEILALAYVGLNKKKKALAILEDGVKKAPDVWLLWQLLGNLRSDLERYAKAHQAYGRALRCPGVDQASVALNTSIVLRRQRKLAEALAALDGVTGSNDELELTLLTTRVGLLNDTGSPDLSIPIAEQALAKWGADEKHGELIAELSARLGEAMWLAKKDREGALAHAWNSVRQHKGNPVALWLIREVQHARSPSARYLRIMVEGVWPWPAKEEEGQLGFFTTYDVVADSPEEALTMLRCFEPEEARDSIRLSQSQDLEPRPDEPKGVYATHGYSFYLLGSSDDGPLGTPPRGRAP